ncbi:unnamed protein product [Cuscuta epithymum]|uniref:DUF4218 domain-containing protein n=1 Tax=Cuscuta epithymum TaxID=186058 RepID=A0AAV0ENU1_9ASTE|nr:unnamed protein product [Cuscuta epithymum]
MNKLTTTTSMKTHDAHVIMQRLLPIALKEMLPEHVWSCITEISLLFQSICSSVLDAASLRRLQESVPILMCNLEKIMPPSFFDTMEHLIIHLPYEALTAGPVFYRWMYRFERFLGELKKKVTNKAHVEASICQAYLQQEISTFSSFYFERDVITRRKRPARNDDIGEDLYENVVSIFNYPGRGKGAATQRYILGGELQIAHTYILMNCPEFSPFYHEFRASLSAFPENQIDALVDSDFVNWYKYQEILELEMPSGANKLTCVLFRCTWVDPTRGVRKNPKYNMIDVNHSRVYLKNEPFILAQQAAQIYYAEYPSTRRTQNPWVCACPVRPNKIKSQTQHKDVDLDAFQQQFFQPPPIVETVNYDIQLSDPNGGRVEVMPETHLPDPTIPSEREIEEMYVAQQNARKKVNG